MQPGRSGHGVFEKRDPSQPQPLSHHIQPCSNPLVILGVSSGPKTTQRLDLG